MEVKLASSSLSLHDLKAHHPLFMDSYCPTLSTPCKLFLDLLVCIQRAAAEIVMLGNGLDHIIPPWPPPFPAPIAERSSSLCQPLIIHLSSLSTRCSVFIAHSNKPLHALLACPRAGSSSTVHSPVQPGTLLCHRSGSARPRQRTWSRGIALFSQVAKGSTRRHGFKLCQGMFRLEIRENFTERVVQPRQRYPGLRWSH